MSKLVINPSPISQARQVWPGAVLGLFLSSVASSGLADTDSPASDEWDAGNLILNGDFASGAASASLPEGWTSVCPNPSIAPQFKWETAADGHRGLTATGTGHKECFGYVRHKVHLEGGKTYRFRVQLRAEGMEDLNRNLVHGIFQGGFGGFNDGIFSYRKQLGGLVIGENRFPGPDKPQDAEVRLYFRFSPAGKVWWERVSLQECGPILPRYVKLACSWGVGERAHWEKWLDRAGEKRVDVALLPEVFNGKSPKDPEPLDGPSGTLLAQKAKQWRMYVTGTFYEKRGALTLNTAPLFDRQGKLVGTYCVNEIYEPELDEGASPGTELPVFDTDFGTVGIMICSDSWFPEITRLLAYKGAELVLLPSAGYFMELMPARAADNGVWIAASSGHDPAGMWDSGGAMAGEQQPDPTRYCPTTISGYEKDDDIHMITATLDLSRHFSPHWWGGPMRSSPGGRRLRENRSIEEDIARESQRWWTHEPAPPHSVQSGGQESR